jgi:hypothetical protein
MAKSASDFGFVECADLITEQHYGRALKFFQLAVSRFLESKSTPKRTEIARQLLHIGAVLEETLKKAYGDKPPHLVLSLCTEGTARFGFLVHKLRNLLLPADGCVELCSGILADESENKKAISLRKQERLCGICMESRDGDELIFLPHAAYMCPGCLEELQVVRDRRNEK